MDNFAMGFAVGVLFCAGAILIDKKMHGEEAKWDSRTTTSPARSAATPRTVTETSAPRGEPASPASPVEAEAPVEATPHAATSAAGTSSPPIRPEHRTKDLLMLASLVLRFPREQAIRAMEILQSVVHETPQFLLNEGIPPGPPPTPIAQTRAALIEALGPEGFALLMDEAAPENEAGDGLLEGNALLAYQIEASVKHPLYPFWRFR